MIGEIAFREEQDKVEMLAKIVATLHWAAPIVARKNNTGVEFIGFFGPRRVKKNGKTVLIYRVARVFGLNLERFREKVWTYKAELLKHEKY